MKKFLKSKKALLAAALAAILAMSGVTYAWFTWSVGVTGGNLEMDFVQIEADLGTWIPVGMFAPDGYETDYFANIPADMTEAEIFIPFSILQMTTYDSSVIDEWLKTDGAFFNGLPNYLSIFHSGQGDLLEKLAYVNDRFCANRLPGDNANVGLQIRNLGANAWIDVSDIFNGTMFEPDKDTSFAVGYGGNFLSTKVNPAVLGAGWTDSGNAYTEGTFTSNGDFEPTVYSDGNREFLSAQYDYNFVASNWGIPVTGIIDGNNKSVPLDDVNAVYNQAAELLYVDGLRNIIDRSNLYGPYPHKPFNPVQLWTFKSDAATSVGFDFDTVAIAASIAAGTDWEIGFNYEGDTSASSSARVIDLTDLTDIAAALNEWVADNDVDLGDPWVIIDALIDLGIFYGTEWDLAMDYEAYVANSAGGVVTSDAFVVELDGKTLLYLGESMRGKTVSLKFDIAYGKYLDNRFTNSKLLFDQSAVVAVQAGGDAGDTAAAEVFGVDPDDLYSTARLNAGPGNRYLVPASSIN